MKGQVALIAETLAQFADAVRESSLKRFRCVAPGDEAWRANDSMLSFVDVLKHLVDADEWLLELLRGGARSRAVIAPGDASAEEWSAFFNRLGELGRQRSALIRAIRPAGLEESIHEPEVLGDTTIGYLILRSGLDHEIHHRGAFQMALRLRYDDVRPRRDES